MTTTITLTNNFHETSVRLRMGDDGRLSPSQVRRAARVLCGISTCTCGGDLGQRGPQRGIREIEITHDGGAIVHMDTTAAQY